MTILTWWLNPLICHRWH